MRETLANGRLRENSENPKGKTIGNLIERVPSRRGRGSEESNDTTSMASSGQWFGRDGVGLGMLMILGWRGKGNGGERSENGAGKGVNLGFVGFGGLGLRT